MHLQSGLPFRDARLAYKIFGTMNSARSNAVIVMTPFGSHHTDIEWVVAPGKAIGPERYFVVFMNVFGNGRIDNA